MQHTIVYGNQEIKFRLVNTDRKSLGITVFPDKKIVVRAPNNKTTDEIYKRIRKRAGWILKQLNHFNSLPAPIKKRQYVNGETHRYLGKQYRLKIIKNDVQGVYLKGGYIHVLLNDNENKSHVSNLLKRWYKKHASERFDIYTKDCYNVVKKYNIASPSIYIREMKNRWGSCGRSGRITLNLNLIKHSPIAIQYVIMHELCHLKYHKHDNNFYKLLKKVMPDWEKRKYKLDHSEI